MPEVDNTPFMYEANNNTGEDRSEYQAKPIAPKYEMSGAYRSYRGSLGRGEYSF